MSKFGIYHHLDGTRDKRYTVEWEYAGQPFAVAVARFCGSWIGAAKTKTQAWVLAQEHYDNHKIDAVYPPVKRRV